MINLFEGLDPHQVYSLLSRWFLYLALLILALYISSKKRLIIKISNNLSRFIKKYRRETEKFLLILFILALVGFIYTGFYVSELDSSTRVPQPANKIVIIEIDDYWNIQDTKEFFSFYGYSMENYRSVSDIIEKHGYTASLGVSPHIFVDGEIETYNLRDDPIMISYLKELESKGFEITMHGYSHCRNTNYCPKYEEVYFNIMEGKKELEEIFGIKLFTYLPPGNTWTTEQYENVKRIGFKMIANTHVPNWYYDEDVIITPRGYDPVYHWSWNSAEFKHTDYTEWIYEYENSEIFILQLHCNTFDSQEKLDDLDKFLEYIKEDGAEVITYKEAYDRLFIPKKSPILYELN